MTKKELVESKLKAVDEPETWQESVRELREVNVQMGELLDDLERRLAAVEARDQGGATPPVTAAADPGGACFAFTNAQPSRRPA